VRQRVRRLFQESPRPEIGIAAPLVLPLSRQYGARTRVVSSATREEGARVDAREPALPQCRGPVSVERRSAHSSSSPGSSAAQLLIEQDDALSDVYVAIAGVAGVSLLLLENPTTIVPGDRVTHLVYDVSGGR
jgi:hypothetical protein